MGISGEKAFEAVENSKHKDSKVGMTLRIQETKRVRQLRAQETVRMDKMGQDKYMGTR